VLSSTVDPEGLVATGARIATAADGATVPSAVAVTPPAADPVSVGVVATLQGRLAGITTYSSTAAAITAVRGQMVTTSAAAYTEQEALNAGSLNGGGSGGGAAPPPAPPPEVPMPTIPQIPVPTIPAPPGGGREVSELIHAGPGPQSLYGAAQQLRSHAGELRSTSSSLRGHSGQLANDWPSDSGQRASSRITELAVWFDQHAQHATAAADSMQSYGESFDAAKSKIPTPQQFQDVENRLQAAATANANPANMGRYAPVVAKYQTELSGLHTKAMNGWSDLARAGGDPSITGQPLQPPPHPQGSGVQLVDYDVPLSPAPDGDPPHGKDPRYWIDVTKIIHVPQGQLAPSGYKQIGPDIWYPSDVDRQQYNVTPPPNPVKYPLDMADIVQKGPGQLGPYGSKELAPGYFAPGPNPYSPETSWPPPQRPVDIRDIIDIPKGTLAPWGYVEYLPGWWVPDPNAGGPR
jgi:hypothetical protein